jgi:hypothetical protein
MTTAPVSATTSSPQEEIWRNWRSGTLVAGFDADCYTTLIPDCHLARVDEAAHKRKDEQHVNEPAYRVLGEQCY